MIEKRTVFVLGAGASCPYGFPTARGLRSDIIASFTLRYENLLEGRERRGVPGVNDAYPRPEAAEKFVERFDRSSTESVDLFLSRNPALARIGKMAICTSILFGEQNSRFREHVKDPNQDWYFHLFSRLSRDLTEEDGIQDFAKNNVAFITFNYDRSLEHFLYESVLNSFGGADTTTAGEQVEQLPIIHVYGTLAPLGWQDPEWKNRLEYGNYAALPQLNLPLLSDNLHIVHEKRENPNIEKAREQISQADRIFFLGFGYAKENLEALGLPGILKPAQRVYGTAMGFTDKETRDMHSLLAGGLKYPQKPEEDTRGKVHLKNFDCVALLREFL